MNTFRTPTASKLSRPALAAVTLLSAAALMVGCQNMGAREKGTAQGAGAGAVAGAVIGSITGGNATRGAVLGGAIGAVAGNLWSKNLEDKKNALAKTTAGTAVAVDRTSDNRLKVNVPGDASFETGSANLQPQLRPVLDELGRNLDRKVVINVIGHTDSTGSAAVNDPLSLDRAESVRKYLVNRGVNPTQISVTGRGERDPVASNDTENGRAMNRRVEIFLAEPQG